MGRVVLLQDLDVIPRRGWLREPAPVTPLPRLAADLGLDFIGVKRDDLCPALHGGSKPRKLDYLLAAPRFADAGSWAASGGIGSGNVVAVTAAGLEMGRPVHAHLFWTEVSAGILDNLAFTASGAASVTFYGSAEELALRRPSLLLGGGGALPAVPPGATTPLGMVGLVRAALELRGQVEAGELPEPSRIYVPLGSGGIAVGLSVGLGLAGLRTTVCAVAVVGRALSMRVRLLWMQRKLAALLEEAGLGPVPPPAPLVVDHGHLGGGYGIPTPESLAACEALAAEGLTLEPVYAGKAMAGLLQDAARRRLGPVLFWQTARKGPLPRDEGWRDRLPRSLRRRLAVRGRSDRRRVIVALGAVGAAIAIGARLSGYPERPGWQGAVLSAEEAEIVRAAAEALLPEEAHAQTLDTIPARVDRYLVGMSPGVLREIHVMLAVLEHGTTPLGGRLRRMTSLPPAARGAYLAGLDARGGLLAQCYCGLRDLVMLAHYQQPETWPAIGYEGPRVALSYDPRGAGRMQWPAYDALIAPAGALPRGIAR